jgi:hypothetical protein
VKGYPLARLLSLRIRRVETARAEVAKMRRLAHEAREKAEEGEKSARDFAAQRPTEEAALFETIRNRTLERKRLDAYHDALAALSAQELELFDIAETMRASAVQAEKNLDAAVHAYKDAVREVNKFEEHRAVWSKAEQKRLEDIQELEAEETAGIAAMRRGR